MIMYEPDAGLDLGLFFSKPGAISVVSFQPGANTLTLLNFFNRTTDTKRKLHLHVRSI